MKFLQRWDYDLHEYQPFMIPSNWTVTIGSMYDEMEDIINCASCGTKTELGECYTSREIHTDIGLGYLICEKCYNEEWERRRKYRDE